METTFIYDILHVVAQALLVPDIIVLLVLIGYALFCIGSILVERFTERNHYAVVMPKFLAALTDADDELIPSIIQESGLLKRQRQALNTVYEYRALPGDALIALVKRLMNEEEAHYEAIVNRNNTAAKVAPMLGLMGTLIPLGPGIQALGNADTAALSSSLLVAFDTTVAGLVTAAVCLVIGKIRSSWYDDYLSALDSAMATLVQRIEDARAAAPQQQYYYQQAMASEINQTIAPFSAAVSGNQQAMTSEIDQTAMPFSTAAPSTDFETTYASSAASSAAVDDQEEAGLMPSGMPLTPPLTPPLGSSAASSSVDSLFHTGMNDESDELYPD